MIDHPRAHRPLPLTSETRQRCSKTTAPPGAGGNALVLVVHRAALARLGLNRLLETDRRFRVCAETGSAVAARSLLLQYRPHLAVLGLTLQDGDGVELIKDFQKLHSGTRSLVLTSRTDALSVQRAFRAGALGYVLSHEQTPQILLAFDCVLRGERYASPQVSRHLREMLAPDGVTRADATLSRLSDRELQVLRRLGAGHGPTQMARDLHLSVKTIETHQAHIRVKLGCRSASEVAAHAERWLLQGSRREIYPPEPLIPPVVLHQGIGAQESVLAHVGSRLETGSSGNRVGDFEGKVAKMRDARHRTV